MVKAIRCPACQLEYTDFAIDWGEAWVEGRHDLWFDQGHLECPRDGPFKLKCELCGHKAWLNYFARTVESAELRSADQGPTSDPT